MKKESCEICKSLLGNIPVIPYDGLGSPYYKYNSPVDGKIAIVAANAFIGTDYAPEDSVFKDIQQCGFNAVNIFHSMTDFDKVLDAVENNGLKALVFHSHLLNTSTSIDDAEAYKRCANTIKWNKDNPAIGGWYFKDVPSYNELIAKGGRSLWEFYDIIKKEDPEHLVQITLSGVPDSTSMDGHTYQEYMDAYQINYLPALWTYDLNPYSVRNGISTVDYDSFYLDLDRYSFRSRILQRPFWAYCPSQGMKSSVIEIPSPTIAYLRFAAFSALGYGAQGIVYSNYRKSDDTSNTKYFDAPIDRIGTHTNTWGYVQQVNKEIAAFNEIFFGCQQLNCLHTVNQYEGTCLLAENCTFGPFSKIESEAGCMGIQISHLNTNGNDYIVMVNHDVEKNQKIKLNKEYFTVKRLTISSSSGRIMETEVSAYSELTLAPGGYAIFKFY